MGGADRPAVRPGQQPDAAGHRHRRPGLLRQRRRRTSSSARSQLDEIATSEIRPQLADDDWAGAAIAAANGYRDALGGSSSIWWWVAGGIVVVGGGGYLIYRRIPRRSRDRPTGRQVGPDGQPQEPLEPLDQLSARSVQTLIDTDNAVRASEFELSAAETEFGHDAVAQFRTRLRRRPRIVDRGLRDPAADRRRHPRGRRDQARDDERDPRPMRRRGREAGRRKRPVRRAARPPVPAAAGARRAAGRHRRRSRPGCRRSPRPCSGCSSSTHRPRWRPSPAKSGGDRAADVRPDQPDAGAATGRGPAPAAAHGHPAAARHQPADRHRCNPAPRRCWPPGPPRKPSVRRRPCWTRSSTPTPTWPPPSGNSVRPVAAVDQELAAARSTLSAGSRPGPPSGSLRAQLDQIQAILGVARSPQGAADPLTALHKVEEADLALDTHPGGDPGRPAAAAAGAGRPRPGAVRPPAPRWPRPRTSSPPAAVRSAARPGPGWPRPNVIWPTPSRWPVPTPPPDWRGPAGGDAGPRGRRSGAAGCRRLGRRWRRRSGGGGLNGAVLGGIILSSVLNSGRSGRGGGGWGGGGFGGGFGGGGGGFGGGGGGGRVERRRRTVLIRASPRHLPYCCNPGDADETAVP